MSKSLSELFEEWSKDYEANFGKWKLSPQFESDKKNYYSHADEELNDLALDYLGKEEIIIYWFNHSWPSFEDSPSNLFKKGNGQIVKDYIESKLRGIHE